MSTPFFNFFCIFCHKCNEQGNYDKKQRGGAVAHGEQKTHFQIGMVAQQRSKAHKHGTKAEPRNYEGQNKAQHIGNEEIAVVHRGQKRGDCYNGEHGAYKECLVVKTVPPSQQWR